MQLPLTSIKEAWGVSTLDDRSDTSVLPKRAKNLLVQKPQFVDMHPNSIQPAVQNRMDIALFDKWLIDKMTSALPQDRTLLVSQLLRSHFSMPKAPEQYTQPMSPFEHSGGERIEYFKAGNQKPLDQNEQLLGILTLTFFFILLDKLISIWNKS